MGKARDGNHAELRTAARAGGLLWMETADLGRGCPDAIVGTKARRCPTCNRRPMAMLEIKDGKLPPSRKRLTPDEAVFHQLWGDHVRVVETIEAVYGSLGIDVSVLKGLYVKGP